MEDSQLYRPVLKKAWQIVKNFKNLWFFGLFAALLGGGGEYEILWRAVSNPLNEASIIKIIWQNLQFGWQSGSLWGGGVWQNLLTVIVSNPFDVIVPLLILLITIGIVIFAVWLAIVSQIGLIKNVSLVTNNKKPTVNDGIDFAVKNFWPVFWANAALKVVIALLLLLLGRTMIFLGFKSLNAIIIYLCLFVIFAILIFIASFLVKYQIYYLILKKQKLGEALVSAWQLFKKNWLISLEMAFVIFIIYLVAIILTGFIAAVLATAPLILPLLLPLPFWLAAAIAVVALFLLIAVALLINAILNAYQWTAWTLLFIKLDGSDVLSKIMRSAQALPNYFIRK